MGRFTGRQNSASRKAGGGAGYRTMPFICWVGSGGVRSVRRRAFFQGADVDDAAALPFRRAVPRLNSAASVRLWPRVSMATLTAGLPGGRLIRWDGAEFFLDGSDIEFDAAFEVDLYGPLKFFNFQGEIIRHSGKLQKRLGLLDPARSEV